MPVNLLNCDKFDCRSVVSFRNTEMYNHNGPTTLENTIFLTREEIIQFTIKRPFYFIGAIP